MAHDISSKQPVRNNAIDVAKGLGIILVVFGHNWIVLHDKGELFRVIYSFHMPLFFFLSGIYIKESETLGSFLRSRADALLKPYFVVLIIVGFAEHLGGKVFSFDYLVGIIYGVGDTIVWTPLWFLPHLFLSSIFVWFVLKFNETLNGKKRILVCVVFLLMVINAQIVAQLSGKESPWIGFSSKFFSNDKIMLGLPFSADLVLITSAYGLLGYLSRDYINDIILNKLMLCVSVVIFCGSQYYFDETMDLNLRVFGNPVVSTLQAFSGIFIVLGLSAMLSHLARLGRLLAYIGASSLFILLFHAYTQSKVFYSGVHFVQDKNLMGVIALVAGVIFPILMLEIAKHNRCFSFLLLPKKYSQAK